MNRKISIRNRAVAVSRIAFAAALLSSTGVHAVSGGEDMKRLATERGCTTCHSDKAAKPSDQSTLPSAPSWPDIAKRYRGRSDAEDLLTRIVQTGTDPGTRHWQGQAAFASMLPNDVPTTPDEARALVRWILSTP